MNLGPDQHEPCNRISDCQSFGTTRNAVGLSAAEKSGSSIEEEKDEDQ
jgi:hypothetical protein